MSDSFTLHVPSSPKRKPVFPSSFWDDDKTILLFGILGKSELSDNPIFNWHCGIEDDVELLVVAVVSVCGWVVDSSARVDVDSVDNGSVVVDETGIVGEGVGKSAFNLN